MKKSCAALAALLVCGVASAQSSVTLFGVVDAAVSQVSNKADRVYSLSDLADPSLLLLPGSVKVSRTELRNSGLSSSRLGFRGVEDLGSGLAASFWLEAPITNDDGATGVASFSRRSTVSLSGAFGEVRLGRDNSPGKVMDDTYDPFGNTGIGSSLIYTAYNHGRISNAAQYFLPANLGGVYGNLMYGFAEKARYSPLGYGERDSNAGRYWGGRIGYANGPLDVSLAYGQLDGASSSADVLDLDDRDTKNKILAIGATYDFGVVKLFGEYSQNKIERSLITADYATLAGWSAAQYENKTKGFLVGVTVPVGAGLIRASYGQVKYDVYRSPFLWTWDDQGDPKANKFALGYVHNLSKRTALYATIARVSNKNGANLTVGGPALSSALLAYGGGTYQPKTSTGYEFGLRHSF